LSSNAGPAGFTDLDRDKLPRHVAVIMDGNGRWAKKRLLNRIRGHEKGADAVREIVRACRGIGIPVLTLYAFSTENWQRPKTEVMALMSLLKNFLGSEAPEMLANNIRLNAIGQIERLPEEIQTVLRDVANATGHCTGMLLNLALSYGGRSEIVKAVREIAHEVQSGKLLPEDVTSEIFQDHLYTRGIPDPDLMIRTSGEMRISNFLLWQMAYSEIVVTDTLWPDFGEAEFVSILKDFQRRERRFGKV
jgi:undecaprenyl diphosphate synthase